MTLVEKTETTVEFTLEAAKCAICDRDLGLPHAIGADFEYQTVTDTFLMMRCRTCESLYLNPRPSFSSFPVIYPDNYHAFDFSNTNFGLIHAVRKRLEARRLMKWCRGLREGAKILDVGCGDGFHLSLLQEFGPSGWHLKGVDTDQRAVDCGLRRGLDIVQGDIRSTDIGEEYDLVLLVMTIEHLNDPGPTLAKIQELLKAGGRLVIVTDNVDSPDHWFFGKSYWGGYHFPRHTYLFSPATLRLLGEQLGFQVDSIRTAVSPVNWTYSIRNLLVDWRAPQLLINQFSLKSPIALAFFTLLDMPLSWLNRGAILHAIFRKPQGSKNHG